jgi:hypothetical protein
MPRGERLKLFLRGLIKFLALVVVAGGIGVALGMGLSKLAEDAEPAGTTETVTGAAAAPPAPAGPPPAPATTATTTSTTTSTTATTATTPSEPPPTPPPPIRVSVLDARLFTDATPSGRREQRARVTVRVRTENRGSERVTLAGPRLRVGSVRVAVDAGGAQLGALAAGASQTVTLRFALSGEATPKLVRDRRARILIAGQSLPMRVRVRASAG